MFFFQNRLLISRNFGEAFKIKLRKKVFPLNLIVLRLKQNCVLFSLRTKTLGIQGIPSHDMPLPYSKIETNLESKVKKRNIIMDYFVKKKMSVICLLGFFTSSSTTRLCRGRVPRLTSDNFTCCHTETERGDHDFCLSRTHYTDTDPTSREQVAIGGIKPRTQKESV